MNTLSQLANNIGTSITVLSHGKIALNKYMASAIKNGIDVRDPEACMVVNIGMYTTDIIVITMGRIISLRSISTSCDTFLNDIIVYMDYMHSTRIDESIAKQIWSAVGSAIPELENAPEPYIVLAPNTKTAFPMRVPVGHEEICHCLFRNLRSLIRFIERIYLSLPNDIQSNIIHRGIYITGEGTSLRGLAKRIEDSLYIPCTAIVPPNVDMH